MPGMKTSSLVHLLEDRVSGARQTIDA